MKSENSKNSNTHKILLNLTDKIDLQKVESLLYYQILVSTIREKI